MGKNAKPTVCNGRLQSTLHNKNNESGILVGSAAWFAWLAEQQRFVFSGEHGRFTARREMRRGQPYWYAYRRREGKLRKAYLGRADGLTLTCLHEADAKLAGLGQHRSVTLDDLATAKNGGETAVSLLTTPSPAAIVNTKLHVPIQPKSLIRRPHLTNQLTTPLTLIHAPDGFGKSTLLTQWAATSQNLVVWVTLDANDDAPAHLWHIIIAALQTVWPACGQRLLPLAATPDFDQMKTAVTSLINEITAFSTAPFALILDDFHFITQQISLQSIHFLINHLPSTMQLLISGDTHLPFSLGQWRAAGILTELSIDDLRLTAQEGIAFLKMQPLTQSLSDAEMRELVRQTNGWAAGLRLAALSLRQRTEIGPSLSRLIREDAYFNDYFVENVLHQQEPHVQQFLLHTSILKKVTADLCNAVTKQENSEQILEHLWRSNLFLTRFGGDTAWYQYHALFKAVLNRQLHHHHPELAPTLHQRAARWYQANHAPDEAVQHLLAISAWGEAAALIETVALRELHDKGEDSRLLRWVQQLPVEVVQQHISLLGTYIRLTNIALSPTHQAQFLQQVENNILSVPEDQRSDDETAVLTEIGRFHHMLVSGQTLSPVPSTLDNTFMLMDTFLRGVQFFKQRDFPNAEIVMEQVLEDAKINGNLFVALIAGGSLIFCGILQGRLQQSEWKVHQLLRWVEARAGRWPAPTSALFSNLAWIAYERDQLNEALQWLGKASDIDPNPTSSNMPLLIHILQARIQAAQGDIAAGLATLRAAFNLNPDMHSGLWTRHDLMLYQALLYARKGDLVQANRLLATVQFGGDGETAVTPSADILLLVLAEIQLAQKEYDEAEKTLRQLVHRFPYGLLTEPLLRPLVMLAAALFAQNKVNQAQKMMEKALRMAVAEGWKRPFLERGIQIASLLILIVHTSRLTGETRRFTQQLVDTLHQTTAGEPAPPPAAIAQLAIAAAISERELEVLRLVSAGLSNQAIAVRMMITVSTVNTYLKNIYRKLDVHSRTEAVLRAQALNLPIS